MGQRWINYYTYNQEGRKLEHAYPSAIDMSGTPFDEVAQDLNVQLKTNDGLIDVMTYYDVASGTPGQLDETMVKQGSNGTPIKLTKMEYVSRTMGSGAS